MNRLLIVGAGGHGKVVAEAAESMDFWDEISFLDDKYPVMKGVLSYSIIGKVADAYDFLSEFNSVFVAVGNANVRMSLMKNLYKLGFLLPSLTHSEAWVSPSATLGAGSVVLAKAVVNADAFLGEGCIVNTSAVVEHDCYLDEAVHVCPNSALGGGVKVGEYSWLGLGCVVIQCLHIGERVVVGAGAVVIHSIEENGITVVGIPAQKVVK